jgi:hypothetical protein
MAARNTRRAGAATPAAAASAVSSVESDLTPSTKSLADFAVEGGTLNGEVSPAAVPSADEIDRLKDADAAPEIDAEIDAEQRAEQLAKFVTGDADAPADEIELAPEIDISTAKDFGGDVVVLVLFDLYRVKVDGLVRVARRGDLIKLSEHDAKRGARIGGVKKIEG